MDRSDLHEETGVGLPVSEGWDDVDVDEDVIFNEIDMQRIYDLTSEDSRQRAVKLQMYDQRVGTDALLRFLGMFPNLTQLRFLNCRFETPAAYEAFENRPIEDLELSLFSNDARCFDSLSSLEGLTSLKLPNLNSASGLDKIPPTLKYLTIHAPDLKLEQCLQFPDLESLDIFSDQFEPELDYPKLAELKQLRRLTMPVQGDAFKHIPDLPFLEEFQFRLTPCCKDPYLAIGKQKVLYRDGDFADFPNLPSLRNLDLAFLDISLEAFHQIISQVPNIRDLTVGNKLIRNDDLLCITQLHQLEKCYFYGTKVKGSTMKKLASEMPECKFELCRI